MYCQGIFMLILVFSFLSWRKYKSTPGISKYRVSYLKLFTKENSDIISHHLQSPLNSKAELKNL